MRYLLDTNIVSDLVRNPQGRAAQRVALVGDSNVCTSIIVAAELWYGAVKKDAPRLTRQLEAVLGVLNFCPLQIRSIANTGAFGRGSSGMGNRSAVTIFSSLRRASFWASRSSPIISANLRESPSSRARIGCADDAIVSLAASAFQARVAGSIPAARSRFSAPNHRGRFRANRSYY